MTPDQLRTEAEMLARRSCAERQDYLYEVERCRGTEVAEALQRLIGELLAQRKNARQSTNAGPGSTIRQALGPW